MPSKKKPTKKSRPRKKVPSEGTAKRIAAAVEGQEPKAPDVAKATPQRESVTPDSITSEPSGEPVTEPPSQPSPFAASVRDPRLPEPGSVITRQYKGRELRVTVLEAGFKFQGQTYSSLSKLAKSISGARAVNGFAWFKLNPSSGGKSVAARLQAKITKIEKAVVRLRAALAEGSLALADAEAEAGILKGEAEKIESRA